MFYSRTTHVFGENPRCFLAHTVASQVWFLPEVSQTDVCRIPIWDSRLWGNGMRSCDLCLGAPVVSGWTALNPQRSRDQRDQAGEQEVFSWERFLSSEPVISHLSLPVPLASVFIREFPLVPSYDRPQHLTAHHDLDHLCHSRSVPQPGSLFRTMCSAPSNRLRQIRRTSKAAATESRRSPR